MFRLVFLDIYCFGKGGAKSFHHTPKRGSAETHPERGGTKRKERNNRFTILIMKVDTEDLISVQSYAHEQRVSTTAVYNWIKNNVVKAVEIDGVKFIITKSPKK